MASQFQENQSKLKSSTLASEEITADDLPVYVIPKQGKRFHDPERMFSRLMDPAYLGLGRDMLIDLDTCVLNPELIVTRFEPLRFSYAFKNPYSMGLKNQSYAEKNNRTDSKRMADWFFSWEMDSGCDEDYYSHQPPPPHIALTLTASRSSDHSQNRYEESSYDYHQPQQKKKNRCERALCANPAQ